MTLAALAFAAGAAALQLQPALPALGWVLLIVPCAALAMRYRWLLVPLAAMAGFFWAAACAQWRMADWLPAELEGRDLAIVGVVSSLPAIADRSVRFEFDVEWADGEARAPKKLLLAWYRGAASEEDAPALLSAMVHPGERWAFTVRLRRPHGLVNPHGFDYAAWLLERGIGATGYVRTRTGPRRVGARNSPLDLIERAREAVRDRFNAVLGATPAAGILAALAGAQGGGGGGDRRGARLYAAGRLRRAGAAHVLDGERRRRGALVRPHLVAVAHAGARPRRDRADGSMGAALAGPVAVLRRGAAHLLRGDRLDRSWLQGSAVGAHPMGDHRRTRAGGAAPLRAALDRRAARQRRGDTARIGGHHAASALRRRNPGRRAARALRAACAVAARIPRMVRFAPRRALAAARAAALDGVCGAGRCGMAARAARHSVAGERTRLDGARILHRAAGPDGRRSVDHHLRCRPGACRAGAHGRPRPALRRGPLFRRGIRQRLARRRPGAARRRRGSTRSRRAQPRGQRSHRRRA